MAEAPDIKGQARERDRRRMAGWGKPLDDLVTRCMAYKADKRPQRMADVRTELQGLVEKLVKRDEDRLGNFDW